jgi:hypothetical protein
MLPEVVKGSYYLQLARFEKEKWQALSSAFGKNLVVPKRAKTTTRPIVEFLVTHNSKIPCFELQWGRLTSMIL